MINNFQRDWVLFYTSKEATVHAPITGDAPARKSKVAARGQDSNLGVDFALLDVGTNNPCKDFVTDGCNNPLLLFHGFKVELRFRGAFLRGETITTTIEKSSTGWSTFEASNNTGSMHVVAAASAQDLWRQICVQLDVEYANIRSVPALCGWRCPAIVAHMQTRADQVPGQRTLLGYTDFTSNFLGGQFIKQLPAVEHSSILDIVKSLGIVVTVPEAQIDFKFRSRLSDYEKKRFYALVNSSTAIIGYILKVAHPHDPLGLLDVIYDAVHSSDASQTLQHVSVLSRNVFVQDLVQAYNTALTSEEQISILAFLAPRVTYKELNSPLFGFNKKISRERFTMARMHARDYGAGHNKPELGPVLRQRYDVESMEMAMAFFMTDMYVQRYAYGTFEMHDPVTGKSVTIPCVNILNPYTTTTVPQQTSPKSES